MYTCRSILVNIVSIVWKQRHKLLTASTWWCGYQGFQKYNILFNNIKVSIWAGWPGVNVMWLGGCHDVCDMAFWWMKHLSNVWKYTLYNYYLCSLINVIRGTWKYLFEGSFWNYFRYLLSGLWNDDNRAAEDDTRRSTFELWPLDLQNPNCMQYSSQVQCDTVEGLPK